MIAHGTQRDSDGFYTTTDHALGTPTRALVHSLDLGNDGPNWFFNKDRLGTLRITATSTSTPIFVGIAPSSDVDSYLSGVSQDEITNVDFDPFRVKQVRQDGSVDPQPPAQQNFWAESASGSGRQAIEWDFQKGTWSAVVMNADAAPRVAVDVSIGAKVPFIFWVAIGLLIAGALILVGGGIATYYGVRGRPATPAVAA
jgi:sorbitol-specific phosphotransferase system component IIBC